MRKEAQKGKLFKCWKILEELEVKLKGRMSEESLISLIKWEPREEKYEKYGLLSTHLLRHPRLYLLRDRYL